MSLWLVSVSKWSLREEPVEPGPPHYLQHAADQNTASCLSAIHKSVKQSIGHEDKQGVLKLQKYKLN